MKFSTAESPIVVRYLKSTSLLRTTEIITIDSAEQMPAFESIQNLSRDRILKILFKGEVQKERETIGNELKERLSGFSILIHTVEPELNIAKLITEKEIEDNQLFFEKCAQDYRQLARHLIFQLAYNLGIEIEKDSPMHSFSKFKNNKDQRGRMNEWEYFLHGIHCGFQHKKTRQIIEVCLCHGDEFGDLDPFFFSRYIKSTPSYKPLPVEIYEDYADGVKIIEKMLETGRFEKINKNEPHSSGVVVTNKTESTSFTIEQKTSQSKRSKFNFWKFIGSG